MRISTYKQNPQRQIRNILAVYPTAIIVVETFTGTKFYGRKELDEKILKKIEPGDLIVFDAADRMSRDADEGFILYEDLFFKNINLVFLKNPEINTDVYREARAKCIELSFSSGDSAIDELMDGIATAVNKYIMEVAKRQIKIAFEKAEHEVNALHERTKEGIETARRNGKQIGQRPGIKIDTKKSIHAKAVLLQHSKTFGGILKNDELTKLTDTTMKTLLKYKKELTEEIYSSSFDETITKYKKLSNDLKKGLRSAIPLIIFLLFRKRYFVSNECFNRCKKRNFLILQWFFNIFISCYPVQKNIFLNTNLAYEFLSAI